MLKFKESGTAESGNPSDPPVPTKKQDAQSPDIPELGMEDESPIRRLIAKARELVDEKLSVAGLLSLLRRPYVLSFVVVAILAAPVYYSFSYFYAQYLFSAGERAVAGGQYEIAKANLEKYRTYYPDDLDAFSMYMRAFFNLGEYNEAAAVVRAMPIETPITEKEKYWFYAALAEIGVSNDGAALENINHGLGISALHPSLNYLLAFHHLYVGEDAAAATAVMEEVNILNLIEKAKDEIKIDYEADLNVARNVMFTRAPTQISFVYEPPSRELRNFSALDESLGFSLPFYAFDNTQTLNLRDFLLRQRGVRLTAKENMRALRILIALLQEDSAQVRLNISDSGDSVLIAVLSAYAAFRGGDVAAALQGYRDILQKDDFLDHYHTYANLRWYDKGRGIPEKEVIAAYERVLEKQPDNLLAVGNLAFLKIYQNDVDAAQALLSEYESSLFENERILVNKSILDIASGELDAAADNLRRYATAIPEAAAARRLLAQIFIRQGKHLEARSAYEDMKNYNQTPEPYIDAVRFYQKRARVNLAIDELTKAADTFKEDKNIISELVLAQAENGNEREVKSLLFVNDEEEVLDNYRVIMAQALFADDDDTRNDLFLRALHQAESDWDKNRVVLAWVRGQLNEGKLQEARRALNFAVKLPSGRLSARLQALELRVNSQEVLGNEENAEEADNLLRDDYKLDVLSRVNIAWAYVYAGVAKRAIDLISGFGEEQKKNRNVLRVLKAAYESVGDNENANRVAYQLATGRELQEGEETGSENVEVITGVDRELAERLNRAARDENYEELVRIYTEILDRDQVKRRSPALTYQNRGAIYLVLEEFERAESDFAQALAEGREDFNDKQLSSVLYNYGFALARSKKVDESFRVLNEAIALDPNNIQTLSLLSQVQLAKEDYEALIITYKKLIELMPKSRDTHLNLARIYRLTSKNLEGIEILRQALNLNANDRQVHIMLAEFYAIIGDQSSAQKHLDLVNRI